MYINIAMVSLPLYALLVVSLVPLVPHWARYPQLALLVQLDISILATAHA